MGSDVEKQRDPETGRFVATQKNPEEMSLEELRAAAAQADLDNSEEAKDAEPPAEAAPPEPESEPVAEAEPTEFIYRREIDLGDGSGVQVFIGTGESREAALEALADKLAEAQRNATRKIKEMTGRVKAEEARSADEDYVIQQRLQKEPRKALREIAAEVIAEREETAQNWLRDQERFVASHPDYLPNTANGDRLMFEIQRLNCGHDFGGLEKAYQSLKASGLLALKPAEADATTAAEPEPTERIAQRPSETPQSRSPRRSSTIPIRGARPAVTQAEPTEDDLYSMPLDKLRKLANSQLAKSPA